MYVLPPEIIHTMNHTTSPNLSSSPEQGTSSFERNPTFEKMKILTTLQQKKPKLLLCTEDSKLYVLYISPPPKVYIPYINEKMYLDHEEQFYNLNIIIDLVTCLFFCNIARL